MTTKNMSPEKQQIAIAEACNDQGVQPMNTPTPRTDAAVKLTFAAGHNTVCPNFARGLERELTANTAERDQLRAEVARLTGVVLRMKGTIDGTEEMLGGLKQGEGYWDMVRRVVAAAERAERAEAAETVALARWNGALERAMKAEADLVALAQCHDDNCRAVVKIDAELTAERARLDWLESHAMAQHSPYISIAELGVHYNGFPGSLRGSIDTAMKKDAK